jgi:hypothetical protein
MLFFVTIQFEERFVLQTLSGLSVLSVSVVNKIPHYNQIKSFIVAVQHLAKPIKIIVSVLK